MRFRSLLPAILLCAVALTVVAVRYWQRKPVDPAPYHHVHTPDPDKPSAPQAPSELRISNDAEAKAADYWLEQVVLLPEMKPGETAELFALYLSVDPQRLTGTRVKFRSDSVVLEGSQQDADKVVWQSIAQAKTAPLTSGEHTFGALWRNGELTIWADHTPLLAWKSDGYNQAVLLNGRSAAAAGRAGVTLKERRALPLGTINFNDNFMREGAAGAWQPVAGRWEMTAQAFPERSANPFALRATFNTEEIADDKLYAGRIRDNDNGLGLGMMISPMEGTLHIARITGNSPAARAGLQEDDIFLEIDGQKIDDVSTPMAYALLMRGYNRDIKVKILRPGEKRPRIATLNREQVRWGLPAVGTPLEPITAPLALGTDQLAFIAAGEPGWSNYTAEVAVKHIGTGGSGLAFGVLSNDDYYCFRWRGPWGRSMPLPGNYDRLQLVQVKGGKEKVLAEKAGGYRPYEFYRLGIDWQGSQVRCLIDGNEVLAAEVPELQRGRIGLLALQGEPVFFDDVRVTTERHTLKSAPGERPVNQIFALESDMAVWGNPALEWDRDLKTGWAVHRGRFFGEQNVVLQKPRFDELTVQLFSPSVPDGDGVALHIKDGRARLLSSGWTGNELLVGPGPFQRIALRASGDAASVEIDGKRLEAVRAPKTAPRQDLGKHPRDRIAIKGLKNLGTPATVRVGASNTSEYSFDAAPVEWKVGSGRWGLLNKWICDPRWSWFGGRTKSIAALWNKHLFSGDISVEAHVALMMLKEELGMPQSPVERAGDYNITLCGDGVNLDSGYTLIFGGENNIWTRLYRKGVVVAESTNEDHRLFGDRLRYPTKPQLHQRWFHIKLEKVGNTLAFYRDGSRAFTYTDPDPLPEGRMAFWTLDNGFLLSRVRVAAEQARPAPFEPRDALLYEDPRVINVFDGEVFTRVVPLKLPQPIAASLTSPAHAFQSATADYQPPGAEPIPADMPGPWAYRVVNATGGGPMALQWRAQAIDPDHRGVLRFAYCIEPGASVDLYLLDISGGRDFDPRAYGAFRWRLTGPKESSEQAPLVGEIPGVVADGKWHTVQVDLQPAWRQFWRDRGFPRTRRSALRLMAGNLDNKDYLLAGFGGNRAGAAFAISDIQLYQPVEVDKQPPQVARIVWPHDPDGDGRHVAVYFDDPGGSGVADETLRVALNDSQLPREVLDFDFVRQRLQIDLQRLGIPAVTAAAPPLKLQLGPFSDRAQNGLAAGVSAEYKYDAVRVMQAKKTVAPPYIRVSVGGGNDRTPGLAPLQQNEVSAMGPTAARVRQSIAAPPWAVPGHQRSIQVTASTDGSTFGFRLNDCSFPLRRFPFLQIDYRIPPETPVNLHLQDNFGMLHALLLTDVGDGDDPFSSDIAARLKPPDDLVADGQWRQTVVPLFRRFSNSGVGIEVADIMAMGFYDNGWRASRRGMSYWIHRVQPLPAGRAADLSFNWSGYDLLPLTDFSACIDSRPDTEPLGQKEIASGETLAAALERRNATLPDGWNYLHVKVRNAAGVWSAPAHQRFFLDQTPPRIVRTEPANNAPWSSQTVKFFLQDGTDIDIRSLRMVVNGRVLAANSRGIAYDPAENVVSFNAVQAGLPWEPDTDVSADLQNLSDIVGNRLLVAHSVAFKYTPSLDRTGPNVARMGFRTASQAEARDANMGMETSFGLSFEEYVGHIQALQDCKFDWIDDPQQAAMGKRCAQFTLLDDGADAQIMLHRNPWYIDRLPMLHFDYRCDPGFAVDLLFEAVGEWYAVKFTGSGAAPEGGKAIGAIEGARADGTWRHASVNFDALLEKAGVKLPVRIINKVILRASAGGVGGTRGAKLLLDNVDMTHLGGYGGTFEWDAERDPSGIAGYSVTLDQNPDTAVPKIITQTAAQLPGNAGSGVWYLHVRACDQAGNWGEQRTYRIDYGGE